MVACPACGSSPFQALPSERAPHQDQVPPPNLSESGSPFWGEQMFLQASPGDLMQHHLRKSTCLCKVPFVFKPHMKQNSFTTFSTKLASA